MPYKDPEKKKQYMKKYNLENREKKNQYDREYRKLNKEKRKEYDQTSKRKKYKKIHNWKYQGIIFSDYDLLFDIYTQTTHCDHCKCELNKCNRSRKCLDHDHSITDTENVRGILCMRCNVEDVLH